ncbi:MAG: hypothetical protein GY798_29580 [Hyphomicrobiales bacterium]|nr:hypothetical protein [Hyphomicrobiales bacterium]
MGPADEICNSPKHPYTEPLLSAVPVPDSVEQSKRQRIRVSGRATQSDLPA